ncbi:VTT domain-containing protein [Nocardiopsis sp. HNM0947]|uniref:VTT domain-containing protein n=1 Tax=Nocardiopsis coralli TaxID=2772213 RepID=A0ABR9PAY4_9ACTN|nr:VTT domain-containing protein [Nocardiopsis coralli]MBE3000989.1 VTT domain-containing protein [Nocardiopsis coralli]
MTTESTTPRPSRDEALRAAEEAWQAEENERAQAKLRDLKPWKGKAQRQDKVLLWLAVVIPAFFLLTMPLRPLFIADHPVPLALITGSYAAIGAGGALASIGQETLWIVVLAGVIGKIKIDWLFWWVGRRWGHGIVRFLVQGERARRFVERMESMNPWVMRLVILFSYLPGVPGGVPHIMAGVSGMRLRTYLLLDALGALMVTAAVAWIGFSSGQTGVDLVLLVDRYATWIMVALIFAMAMLPSYLASRDAKRRKAAALAEAAEAYDAETERLDRK